ncbi:hypothetical protein EMIT091MI3_40081 [Kosakonia quasisacchari]
MRTCLPFLHCIGASQPETGFLQKDGEGLHVADLVKMNITHCMFGESRFWEI